MDFFRPRKVTFKGKATFGFPLVITVSTPHFSRGRGRGRGRPAGVPVDPRHARRPRNSCDSDLHDRVGSLEIERPFHISFTQTRINRRLSLATLRAYLLHLQKHLDAQNVKYSGQRFEEAGLPTNRETADTFSLHRQGTTKTTANFVRFLLTCQRPREQTLSIRELATAR